MISKQHKIIIDNLKEVMEEDIRCRNDDMFLLFKYWTHISGIKEEDGSFIIPKTFLNEGLLTNAKSLFRGRRYLQNSLGEYLPTDPRVAKKRRISEKMFRKFYADNPNIIKSWEEHMFGIK